MEWQIFAPFHVLTAVVSSNVNFCFSSFFSLQSALQREEEEEADDEWALMCILLAAAEEPLALALEAIEQRSFSYKHLTTQTTLPVQRVRYIRYIIHMLSRLQHFSCTNAIIKECVICFAMFHYHSPPLYLLSIIRRPKSTDLGNSTVSIFT